MGMYVLALELVSITLLDSLEMVIGVVLNEISMSAIRMELLV